MYELSCHVCGAKEGDHLKSSWIWVLGISWETGNSYSHALLMHTLSMPLGYYLRGESKSGYCLGWKPVVLTIHFSGPASQTHEWILEREREREKKKAVKKRIFLFKSLRHWKKFKDTMLWSSHRKLYHRFHTHGSCHFSLRSHSGPGWGSDYDPNALWACLQLSPPIARPTLRLQTTYSPRLCSRCEASLASPYTAL